MDYCRPCGCKGRRSCLICEKEYDITPPSFISDVEKSNGFLYCNNCNKAWSGWNYDSSQNCWNHTGDSISVQGIYVQTNFITEEEKEKLLEGMSKEDWSLSQSGRRKQNYGPKCNFKKNKIQIGNFNGFPDFSKIIHNKLKTLPILKNYYVIEQCSLEYNPNRGASIDPHIDDCWVWGERIITVNVLGDTYLTLSKYSGEKTKYNLDKVKTYPRVLDENGCLTDSESGIPFDLNDKNKFHSNVKLRIFMPEKSLIILYGSARYEWEHCVLREDIKTQRICLTYREFTPPFLPGGENANIVVDILNKSNHFF